MRLFSRFLPHNAQFHKLMLEMTDAVCAGGAHLRAYVENSDVTARATAQVGLQDSRARSKAVAQKITEELCRSYITPFDRDDIQDFTDVLYKIPKIIEKVRARLDMYDIHPEHGDILRQIDVIVAQAAAMREVVSALVQKPDSSSLQSKINVLYDLEDHGDLILSELLADLFNSDKQARDLILRKSIYDMLEKIIDQYRDAGGVISQIVLKHG